MIKKPVNINLATHPVRNRRLFFSLLGIGVFLLLITAGAAAHVFWVYQSKNEGAQRALERLEDRMRQVQREEIRITARIEQIKAEEGFRLDLYNDLIFQKSFSWIELLNAMEEALPGSCYMSSLSPLQKKENQLEIRCHVAYPSLDSLLDFISNLHKIGFKNIQVKNETEGGGGYKISEMSLRYERIH